MMERKPAGQKEMKVFKELSLVPLEFDSLAGRTGMDPPNLLAALTTLELEGWIERLPGNRFVRKERSP